MNSRQFGRILFLNSIIIVGFNLLFTIDDVRAVLSHRLYSIPLGLSLYLSQALLTRRLLGRHKNWLSEPFRREAVLMALVAIVAVYVLTSGFIYGLTPEATVTFSQDKLLSFLLIFLLNSLPGALMEEWLFRYLPYRFGKQHTNPYYPVLLCLGTLALFILLHIPAYLFQYKLSLVVLGQVALFGFFFVVVYLLTKNLVFTALFHALTNNSLYLFESPYNNGCLYISILSISCAWALINKRNILKATALRKD